MHRLFNAIINILIIAVLFFLLLFLSFSILEYWNMGWYDTLVPKLTMHLAFPVLVGMLVIYMSNIKSIFSNFNNNIEYKEAKQLYDEGKYDIAFPKLKELAEKGYKKAYFYIARMHKEGLGTIKNEKKAFQWYHKAARQGCFKAQNNLGMLYEDKGDDDNALKWYRKSVKKGNPVAQNNLGLMYENKGKYDEALKWYSKAVEQGYAGAKNNLGGLYARGWGVDKDLDKARELALEAVEEGIVGSQSNIASLYLQSELQNYDEAFKWFSLASKHGLAQAQYNLAMMYHNGKGVSKSFTKAYMWGTITLANDELDEKYKKRTEKLLQKLVRIMTFADITKAKEMAKRCMESGYKDCGEE